jgi:kumamolisin
MADHVVLPDSSRARPSDAQRGPDLSPDTPIDVTVALAGSALPEPSATSPISREELEREHGTDQKTIARVTEVLERFGLSVDEASPLTRSLRVSGSAAQMEAAFHPSLATYTSPDQGEFRGREGELQIPAELAGMISGIFGLDERRVARRRSTAKAPLSKPVSPAELSSHYNFPSAEGVKQTVAIAEFGGGYFAEDLTAFCSKQGTPVPAVTAVGVNGAQVLTLADIEKLPQQKRTEQLEDSVEVNMDVQIVAGLVPGAEVIVYFAAFDQQGWVDLLNEVIAGEPTPAVTVSVSWGLAEDDAGWSKAARKAIDERLQAAAALGITVCVAAGDDGSADQETDGRAHVDFPASSPHVLAVGGTMFQAAEDVVWWEKPGERTNSGGGATGGGVSVEFPRPSWQDVTITSLNAGSIDGRVVPDVAALAGPPFYDLVFMGKDSPNGGTSAATPTWAALIALLAGNAEHPWKPAFLAPQLYANSPGSTETVGAAGCTDVTTGDNTSSTLGKGYAAGSGFDAVSGWGVPDGTALLAALTG